MPLHPADLHSAPFKHIYSGQLLCDRGPHAVARFAGLGALVAAVCGASFGPFIALGQLPQVCILLLQLCKAASNIAQAMQLGQSQDAQAHAVLLQQTGKLAGLRFPALYASS